MEILKPTLPKILWLGLGIVVAKFVLPKLPAPLNLG